MDFRGVERRAALLIITESERRNSIASMTSCDSMGLLSRIILAGQRGRLHFATTAQVWLLAAALLRHSRTENCFGGSSRLSNPRFTALSKIYLAMKTRHSVPQSSNSKGSVDPMALTAFAFLTSGRIFRNRLILPESFPKREM
jgi:hypothetical protein